MSYFLHIFMENTKVYMITFRKWLMLSKKRNIRRTNILQQLNFLVFMMSGLEPDHSQLRNQHFLLLLTGDRE